MSSFDYVLLIFQQKKALLPCRIYVSKSVSLKNFSKKVRKHLILIFFLKSITCFSSQEGFTSFLMEFFWNWCPAAAASLNFWIHLVNQTAYMYHWSATTQIFSIFQLLQLFFLCSNCSPILPIVVLPFRIVWLLKVIDHQYASILSCIGSQLSCMLFSFVILGRIKLAGERISKCTGK